MGLYKRPGSGKWWCRFEVAGREIKRSTRTADRRAAEIEERRLRAYFESKAPPRRAERTGDLAELAGLDVERAAALGATKEHQAAIEWLWERIAEFFGATAEPRVINFDSVQKYIAHRRSQGATDTIAREVQALKRGCKIAHRRGWLAYMPDEWPKVVRGPKGQKRRGRLHPPEILAAWLRALDGDARDEAEVVLLTGLRKTEAKRLTAQWIEPAPEGAAVPAVLRIPANSAKARRERVIGLPQRALDILKRRAEKTPAGKPLLFQGSHETAYRLARERLDPPYKTPISLRDLRHTWATLVTRMVGVDAARDGLGHRDLSMTSRYVSTDTARVASAAAAVAELLSRHSEVGTGALSMERATRFELATFSLEGQENEFLRHLSECHNCRQHVSACLSWTANARDPGTGEPAHVARRIA